MKSGEWNKIVANQFLTFRYIDKALFTKIASEGDKKGFNRQVDPAVLPKLTNENFPVTFVMIHEHIGGRKAAPHARCEVHFRMNGSDELHHVLVDMTLKRFESLPQIATNIDDEGEDK